MRRLFLVLLALCLLPGLALAGKAGPPAGAAAQAASKVVAKAAPVLDCPASVDLGEGFVLRLRSARPLAGVSLTWLGRTTRLSGRGTPGGWEAVALLGSDVGNTAVGRHDLVVRSAGKAARVLRRSIQVRPVKRPVERLTLDEAMVTPPEDAYPRILAERKAIQGLLLGTLSRAAAERYWSLPLARPVPGEVSSMYGIGRILNGQPHSPHRGLDMEAETGEPVLAAADGQVLFSGELYYAGNAVYLDHGQGLVTAYFHLSGRSVLAGGRVARGQVLGLAGDTGRSTRSHLHFGVWAFGRPVDPAPLFLYALVP
jgi:murein DD-endopeptidase MepM/ murein hydrolase activator NlpD